LAPCLLYNLGDIATRANQPAANKQVTFSKKLTKEGEDKLTVMSSLYIDTRGTKGIKGVFSKVALEKNKNRNLGLLRETKPTLMFHTSYKKVFFFVSFQTAF
jgi:hypothetical protein